MTEAKHLIAVERSFAEPQQFEPLQAAEDAARWCLDMHEVSFVKTFFALDGRRMICLYQAPDAEAVRRSQRMAGLPFDTVYAVVVS